MTVTVKGFIKKLAGFSVASWFSAGISFLVTPVFTRLYLPDDIGHINLFMTYVTFFQTLSVLALDQAFMRFYNEDLPGLTKQNFLRYCLRINMIIASINALIVLFGYRFFSLQVSGTENLFISICLAAVIICSTFLRMSSICSRMEQKVGQYTAQVILTSVVEKVLYTLIAFYRADYRLAILSITVGYMIVSSVFFLWKRKTSLLPAQAVPRETLKIILKFSLPYVPVLLLSWLNNSIPLLVLKNYVDYSAVGIYTNAVTIANILTIIQTGFSAYWGPFIYEHYRESESAATIQKIERLVVALIIGISLCVVLFQDVIYLLVGEKFRASKVFFPFLMFTPICNTIADMTGIGIMLSRKSYLNIFTFLGNTSVNLLLSYLLVPQIGVMGAGIAVAASALTMLIIRSILGGRYYKIMPKCSLLIYSLIIWIAACIINVLFSDQGLMKSILLIVLMLAFAAAYVRDITEIISFMKSKLFGRKRV